jgi:hypothetical protein
MRTTPAHLTAAVVTVLVIVTGCGPTTPAAGDSPTPEPAPSSAAAITPAATETVMAPAAAPTAPSTPGLSRGASGGALNTPGAAPKIALKMDFSAFGKK